MIRVILVDDQMLVRSGIAGLLAMTSDIQVAGEAGNAQDAILLLEEVKPDVMLLDVRMPGRSGIELLVELKSLDRLPPTILLTTFDDDEALLRGIRAGARGFLLKDISLERLAEDIRRVSSGLSVIRPSITERLFQTVQGSETDFESSSLPDKLTSRETEVLRMMASGLSNREISEAFSKSEGTVKNQVSSILSKLGVRDRVRAVLRGIELGLI
ncbi:response regulator [Alkalimonas amylolytica]|uniref:Two component transcriptional regulator, LuxR family n=1 Tax=Alkalimonas amylolytica TaxID=152573 RepID=A0A1H4D0C0_ALKAM|nr:response regulator transcription factor [Alkalimonas amylolytica]SEA66048.1 two component transcriptional regulator, LuxR family [Alkalimonas amylolytica]